jgi:putative hydrolases of HD superfamily
MDIIEFSKIVGRLKTLPRTGWVTYGKIEKPESVADHIMRLTVIALVAGDELGVNTQKLVNMAIIHDLGESLVGDLITESGLPKMDSTKEKKHDLECQAFRQLFGSLKNGQKFIRLWEEYEQQGSKEAKVLKQLDKFEMALQALEYEEFSNRVNFATFWDLTGRYFKHPVIKEWFRILQNQRKKE